MTPGDGPVAVAELALTRNAGVLFDAPGRARLGSALPAVAARTGRPVRALVEALHGGDPATVQALMDEVTLQETRWLRDPEVFDELAREVIPGLPRDAWIWSAGCAHGQEAHSLAILAAEAQREDLRILATDVSRAAVARAGAGLYEERELRGLGDERRERWFARRPDGHRALDPVLLRRVTCARHNLARDPLPEQTASCALVLCRNVLIYVQPEAITGLLGRLHATLPPGAVVVVGAAEALWHRSELFAAERLGAGYAYRPAPAGRSRPARTRLPASAPRPRRTSPPGGPADPPARPVPSPTPELAALLAHGERAMADGAPQEAVAAFRRAVYAEPRHVLAHVQLGLALESLGDEGAPRAFRAAWAALQEADAEQLASELGGHAVEDLARMLVDRLDVA